MRCDMSLTKITKITFSGTYTDLQLKRPLGNALLEFLILLFKRDYIDIRDEIGSRCKWTVQNAQKWTVHNCGKWTAIKDKKCMVQ